MHSTRSAARLCLRGVVLLVLIAAACAQVPPIRIMTVGDSITYGWYVPGGYRSKLHQSLTAAGYNVDFVGTQTENGTSTLPDSDHEGHRHWLIGHIDANIARFLDAVTSPDVILLHIGTNDFVSLTDTPNAINRLDALVAKIATLRPFAHIIVTNLLVRYDPFDTAIQTEFNAFLQERVNAHAALGRRVTFLDIRSYVPLWEIADEVHPNQAGYDHMADAWLPAIQSVIGPLGDNLAPALAAAVAIDPTHVVLTFNKPVQEAALSLANYAINDLTVSAATLDAATKREVTLTTSPMAAAATYTATISGVRDRTPAAHLIAPASTITFSGAYERGAVNTVPEAAVYSLVYSLNIPEEAAYNSTPPVYEVDRHATVGSFSRIAYYLELQRPGQSLQYCWVSMNAFTADAEKIGVPHSNTNAFFQQAVTGMNVSSNVAGVITGTGLTGNLEFWPAAYMQANSAGTAGASGNTYDFGDQPVSGQYGSMQIHNPGSAQTLIAFNSWCNAGMAPIDLGIGNSPVGEPDWTFAWNAGGYSIRTLQVYVLPTDTTPPAVTGVTPEASLTRILVTFSEALGTGAASAANFHVEGLMITAAILQANGRDIELVTSPQTPATPYTLTISNVADLAGNAIAPATSIGFSSLSPPDVASRAPEAASYTMVQALTLPGTNPNWLAQPVNYAIDQRAIITKPFDRIGYYMELNATWVWVSVDAFTTNLNRIGVPTLQSGAQYQRAVTNMNVAASAGSGVVTGTGMAGGNLEFWPHNYLPSNSSGVANASNTLYDWGDAIATTGYYGSMQIHNNAARQTVFAFNNWGSGGGICDLGIGNRPASHSDWTFAGNATGYTNRKLCVFVRTYDVAPAIVTPPAARTVPAGNPTTFSVTATGTGPLAYQWRRNNAPIAGATSSKLTLPNVQVDHAGIYDVAVTNAASTVTSSAAMLSIVGITDDPFSLRLVVQEGGVQDKRMEIRYTGSPRCPFTVQRSTDLVDWTDIATVSADANGAVSFTDQSPPGGSGFYRLLRITP